MNDQNKPVSSAEATANPIPSPGRRRLVKGALLTVPAIMTLRNGAAWAGISHKCAIGTTEVLVPIIDQTTGLPKQDSDGNPLTTTETRVVYSTPCLVSLGYDSNATP